MEVEWELQNTEVKDDGERKKCVRQPSMFSGVFTMESEWVNDLIDLAQSQAVFVPYIVPFVLFYQLSLAQ